MERRAKYVLDAAAILNSNFFLYDGAVIPESVVREVKSRSYLLSALLESGKLKIQNPKKKTITRVKKVAEKMGETNALSQADIDVLALALETGGILVTDDFHVQNVAKEVEIPVEPVTESIREKRRYVLRCVNCGRTYPPTYRGKRCRVCGGKLVYFSKSELSST